MNALEMIAALKGADEETAMELVDRLQCGEIDCSVLPTGKDNAVQQAQIWAQEARTQKGIVEEIGKLVGCANDWEMVDAIKAALSANGGEAVPVAWAVFADSGNIRIWGQEKPEAFPEAVPLYLSQTVKESLTAHLEPIGYADPDTLTDYRAGERLHIPVYRPDASAEWQSGIPVYLHPAPPSVAVPEEEIKARALEEFAEAMATKAEQWRHKGSLTNEQFFIDCAEQAYERIESLRTAGDEGEQYEQ